MSELLEPFLILKYLAAVLSLYAPGYAVLMCFDRNKTCVTGRGLGATIAYSLLISCLLLTIVPLGLGMLNIHFLREFYFAYSIVSVLLVLCAIFKTVRQKFEPVKVIFRKLGNAAVSDKVFWILVVLLRSDIQGNHINHIHIQSFAPAFGDNIPF